MASVYVPASRDAAFNNLPADEAVNGLDVDTERGRMTDQWEENAKAIFEKQYNSRIVKFGDKRSIIDWAVVKNDKIIAVVEHKSRPRLTPEILKNKFQNVLIIGADKIEGGQLIARLINNDFYLSIYFVPTNQLMLIKLWDAEKSDWCVEFNIERKITQNSINGGTANRLQAFITVPEKFVLIEGNSLQSI